MDPCVGNGGGTWDSRVVTVPMLLVLITVYPDISNDLEGRSINLNHF
jgi:hypothetical protein